MTEDARNDIPQDEEQISVPESHKAELLRRYRRYQSDPDLLLSLEELKERLAKRGLYGRYFVEWDCGADLSADTIEARWELLTDAEIADVALDAKSEIAIQA